MANRPIDFEPIFRRIEAAIDGHPTVCRITTYDPRLSVDRLGCSVSAIVKIKGSRKKPTAINAHGDSFDEAVDSLIAGLDAWSEAIR